jgi:hypothetical protein
VVCWVLLLLSVVLLLLKSCFFTVDFVIKTIITVMTGMIAVITVVMTAVSPNNIATILTFIIIVFHF